MGTAINEYKILSKVISVGVCIYEEGHSLWVIKDLKGKSGGKESLRRLQKSG